METQFTFQKKDGAFKFPGFRLEVSPSAGAAAVQLKHDSVHHVCAHGELITYHALRCRNGVGLADERIR